MPYVWQECAYACIVPYFLCSWLMEFRSLNLYPRSIQNHKRETRNIKQFDSGHKKCLKAIFFLSLLGTWNSTSFWPWALLSGSVKYNHSKISSNRFLVILKNRSLYIIRRPFYCHIYCEGFVLCWFYGAFFFRQIVLPFLHFCQMEWLVVRVLLRDLITISAAISTIHFLGQTLCFAAKMGRGMVLFPHVLRVGNRLFHKQQ